MKSLLLLALGLARTVVLGARIEAERIVVSVRPYKREQRRCLYSVKLLSTHPAVEFRQQDRAC